MPITEGRTVPPRFPLPNRRRYLMVSRVLLFVVLVAALAERVVQASHKTTLAHDEGVTYLVAAGNQGRYAQRTDLGVSEPFVGPASAVKRHMEVGRFFTFRKIGHDLARHDVHPPVYFWLLHVWLFAVGTHLYSGPLLNAVLCMCTGLLLYGAGRVLLRSRPQAVAAVAVCLLCGPALRLSAEARHYDLLMMASALLLFAVGRAMSSPSVSLRAAAVVAAAACIGFLSHYHFVLLASAVGLFVVLAGIRGAGQARRVLAAMVVGVAVAMVIHYDFYLSFARHGTGGAAFGSNLWGRCVAVANALSAVVLPQALSTRVLPAVAVCVGLLVMASWWSWRNRARFLRPEVYLLWPTTLLVVGGIGGLYAAGLAPQHAMGAKYLAAAWPGLSCALVSTTNLLGPRSRTIGVLLCSSLIAILGLAQLSFDIRMEAVKARPYQVFTEAQTVIIDSRSGMIVLPMAFQLHDSTRVVIGTQDELASASVSVYDAVVPPALFLEARVRGASSQRTSEIAGRLAERLQVIKLDQPLPGFGKLWAVLAKSESAPRSSEARGIVILAGHARRVPE